MQQLHKSNLSPSEVERYAYLAGDSVLALYAAEFEDLDGQVDGFDDQLDAAKKQSYDEGRIDGMGADTFAQIKALEHQVERIQASCNKSKENLLAVYEWLRCDGCKTIKGRKDFESKVRNAWLSTVTY